MKHSDPVAFAIPLLSASLLILMPMVTPSTVFTQTVTATPTYDPIAQPPLPPNPTELELGHYLFWRHCMTCHGDKGQGLTDEFRSVWEPDHQNCWARGCHSGKYPNDGFPIPTVIPAIVTTDQLAQFETKQALFDFLKATHPPQYPGFLKDEEYHAIVAFVFEMNHRPLIDPTNKPAITPTSTLPPSPEATQPPSMFPFIVTGGIFLIVVILFLRKRVKPGKKKDRIFR